MTNSDNNVKIKSEENVEESGFVKDFISSSEIQPEQLNEIITNPENIAEFESITGAKIEGSVSERAAAVMQVMGIHRNSNKFTTTQYAKVLYKNAGIALKRSNNAATYLDYAKSNGMSGFEGLTVSDLSITDLGYLKTVVEISILNQADAAVSVSDLSRIMEETSSLGNKVLSNYIAEKQNALLNSSNYLTEAENGNLDYDSLPGAIISGDFIQIPNTEHTTKRPTWRESELDVAKLYPQYKAQRSFIGGKEVKYGTKGSSRPDFYLSGSSIEVKNYNVTTARGKHALIKNISKQANQRISELPSGTSQTVIIDIRGQQALDLNLTQLKSDILTSCNTNIKILFLRWC